MSLAPFVATLGRGPGRSRSLSQDEAHEAMRIMLTGKAAPEALGAILMLLRMKGETAPEIAGFAAAAQAALPNLPEVDLDWPCYAAGRTRGLPWFLLAAKLVSASGTRVLLHGWNGRDDAVRKGVAELGIACVDAAGAAAALDRDGIAYMPLETLHPALFHLLDLRDTFGLRSCVNTVCRMLNPARAMCSVQGVFHPSYRLLQQDAASLLDLPELMVIKGGGGEFERHPGKPVEAFGLREGAAWQDVFDPLDTDTRRLVDLDLPTRALTDLWLKDQGPDFARDLVLGTAGLALQALGRTQTPHQLWQERFAARAA